VRKLALVLLFFLLLGLGLFVLFWLDQRSKAKEGPVPPAEPPRETPVPEQEQGYQLGGRSQLTLYDEVTRRALLRGESDDTRTEGDVDTLTGVTLELLDPQHGEVQVRLRAKRAQPKRRPQEDQLGPRWEARFELEGVHAEVLGGTPFAPLTLDTESATVDFLDPTKRHLSSRVAFHAHSRDLLLQGTGFELALDEQRLRIETEGHVEFTPGGVATAKLDARGGGPLEVSRALNGPLTLETWKGAVLEPGATDSGRLTSDHMVLEAREDAGGEQRIALDHLKADGAVDWTSGTAHFQGERLDATFAPEGRLERAHLAGGARVEATLALSNEVLKAGGESKPRTFVLEGQDELDVAWRDGGYTVHVEGQSAQGDKPARIPSVVTDEVRLQSASAIDGWLADDQRSARFRASGGVLVTAGETTLETPTFDLDVAPDERGEPVLTGTATGGARLEGKLTEEPGALEAPRSFTLTSPDGLKLERSAGGWRVLEATRVELTLEGPRGFRARAERIEDFAVPRAEGGAIAVEGLRLRARGTVEVTSAEGRLTGEELEVQGLSPVPHLALRGTPQSLATFRGESGEARALEVERTGDTYYARGNVQGSAVLSQDEGTPARLAFTGDALTYDRSDSGELISGERLRTQRVLVDGRTSGTVTAKGQTLVFKSERFAAESRVRLVEGRDKPVELGSLFTAEGAVHVDFAELDSDLSIDCEHIEIERGTRAEAGGFEQLSALGNVRFQGHLSGRAETEISGECESFTLGADRRGSLSAGPYGRVLLHGFEPERQAPFRLTAEHVEFDASQESLRLLAVAPEVRTLGLRARAEHFTADEQEGVVLSGAVRVSGSTPAHLPYTLDAEHVVLMGRLPAKALRGAGEVGEPLGEELDSMQASGNVEFHLSDGVHARGERLSARRSTGILRLEGTPATFEIGTARLQTEWVEFDPVLQLLVGTGRGQMTSLEEDPALGTVEQGSWTLEFLAISSLLDLDSVILAVQEPVFRSPASRSALRASWGVLWLNREVLESLDRGDELLSGLELVLARLRAVPEDAGLVEVLDLFRSAELAGLLREVYFEGPVEVLSEGELLARTDALYIDAAGQHGWLAGATVNLGRQFLGQRQEKLIIKADWLRISSDASLRADRATVTACGFDEPHVQVVTGDLKIRPTARTGKARYELVLKDNGIELYGLLKIPLPTIDVSADEDFKPIWPTLSLANSARFGTLLSFAFTRPAERVGRFFDALVRPLWSSDEEPEGGTRVTDTAAPAPEPRKRSELDANYKIDGSYLGSRGGLLDLGLEIEAKNEYWFDLYLGLILDRGEDRGFIRDEQAARDSLRRWLRGQAYFDRGKSAWTFSYSNQSDVAVQSEFYEGRFLRYERSEDYAQWRRSSDEYFAQASVKLKLEDFRSDVEELPSVGFYRGRSPLFDLGPLSFLHTGELSAEYLRRRAGTDPHSPFEFGPLFGDAPENGFGTLDGLGERELVRVDTSQTLEVPVALGAAFKLTPFVSLRASAWSAGVDPEDSPSRFFTEAGARLGTTLWKRALGGELYQIAPFVEYRNLLERHDRDGEPLELDARERVVTADAVRFGSRGRFGSRENTLLDLDLVAGYASDRSDGAGSGWLPLEVLAGFATHPRGHELNIYHEGRYDLEAGKTEYSVLSVGTHLGEQWGVQLSHQRGRNAGGDPLFEAAAIAGLYRWTEKWEFEAREFFSLLENQQLGTRFTVRRYGHDLVFELESSFREGEGSSIGFNVKPRFGYHPPRIGYVPW
jgi:hypothetical protein